MSSFHPSYVMVQQQGKGTYEVILCSQVPYPLSAMGMFKAFSGVAPDLYFRKMFQV